MPCRGKVDPDLVRPACGNAHIAKERIGPAFQDGHVGQGRLAMRIRGMDRTKQRVRHRAYGRIDRYLLPGRKPAGKGAIALPDLVRRPLAR